MGKKHSSVTIGLLGKKCRFLQLSRVDGSGYHSDHQPVRVYTLCAAFEKVANASRGEEELTDKDWRIVEASTSFQSDVWKHFGFATSAGPQEVSLKINGEHSVFAAASELL